MNKSYRKGFTLVELLAVIVILAIILVIAVPKIMTIITDSKKSSLETSAKIIASAAEKRKLQNKLAGKVNEEIKCEDVAKITTDYEECVIKFDSDNHAIVNLKGSNKFEGLYVCGGTKNNAETTTDSCFIRISIDYSNCIYEETPVCDDISGFYSVGDTIDLTSCQNMSFRIFNGWYAQYKNKSEYFEDDTYTVSSKDATLIMRCRGPEPK